MTKIHYDKNNIQFSQNNLQQIKSLNLKMIPFCEKESKLRDIEYLLIHSKIQDQDLQQMKNCKYIGIRAHNTDYINTKMALELQIDFSGLKNQHGINAVAEHTFALIFSIAKNIILSHTHVREGKWRQDLKPNYELSGKKLGIIGYGQIGKKVGEIGKILGMDILIASKTDKPKEGEMGLLNLLAKSDVISLHLSSRKENENFIDKKCLNVMKEDAILINTARGSVMDYSALANELKKGKFLGVGLDVFPEEPLDSTIFADFGNVVLTPHIAYLTEEALENMNGELLDNLKAHLI